VVRATDINYAGHLGNESLLELVHEARAHFMKELGFNTIIGKTQSTGLIIADLVVNYKAEAFLHDLLTIDCQVGELSQRSFRLFYRIRRDGQVIALAEMGVVAFAYDTKQVVELPAQFLDGLDQYRAGVNNHNPESAG
jgi:YbgC/YbaW family acyl-CoA thioester hydrolase